MKNKLKHHIKNILFIIYLLNILFCTIVGGATLIAGALNIPLWIGAIIYIILLIFIIPAFNLIVKN